MNRMINHPTTVRDKSVQWLKQQRSSLIALAVMLAFAAASIMILFPRHVAPDAAAVNLFSGERAMRHLPWIASEPHPSGSPAQARVRDYLISQLEAMNLAVEVQKVYGAENVLTRLDGSNSTGAVVVLSHYDSVYTGAGAADNGSGTAVLLEIARALAVGPKLANDMIILFDDGEELPDMFTGSKAFVREHRWMKDVKIAISLDTAVAGPISVCETGQGNGVLIQAMARTYTNAAWTSFGNGAGGYDSAPFRDAGIMTLALEDNYPFKEKHTDQDVIDLVQAGSVQQMGDQVLALMRQLGNTDLHQPRAAQETYFPLPFLFLIHYPESWTLPLFLLAAILLISLIIVAIRRRIIRWQGFLLALAVILAAMAAAAVLISLLTPAFPRLFKWNVELWPDWPEVIPPNGLAAFAGLAILTTALGVFGYRLTRRISSPADFTLAVLMLMFMMSAAATFASPPAAYAFIWPVLIGSLAWLMILLIRPLRAWPHEISATLTALPLIVLLLPFIPGIVMADGTKSLAILGAVLIPILFSVLAAIDQLVYQPTTKELSRNPSITRSSGKRSRP